MNRTTIKKIGFTMILGIHTLWSLSQKPIVVSGIISDKNNEPYPGATIQLKGTTLGAFSNIDGTYSISIPDSLNSFVLQYSFIVCKTKEVMFVRDSINTEKFITNIISDGKK